VAVNFCEFLLQKGYQHREVLLTSILPALFLYQDLTNRIVVAANLPREQLNAYTQDILYNTLTSQQDIPQWLFPHVESYLTNFKVQTINPDHQQFTPEERKKTCEILDILVMHNQKLPEQLRPYIFCWHAINDFFAQPVFTLNKLQVIHKQINMLVLNEAMRQELNQEMIAFLSTHVKTEVEVTRVIDNFGDLLLQAQKSDLPKHLLLLKEMASLHGKANYNWPRTNVYIKVVLGEAINLSVSGIGPAKQTEFVNECLDNLLASVNPNRIGSIQTKFWPPAMTNMWKAYLSQRATANTPGKTTKPTIPVKHGPDRGKTTVAPSPLSFSGGNQPPISLPDPSQGKSPQPQVNTPDPSTNSTNQPATQTTGQHKFSLNPSFSESTRQPIVLPDPSQIKSPQPQVNTSDPSTNSTNQPSTQATGKHKFFLHPFKKSKSIEEELQEFLDAMQSQRADRIAAAYSESIDGMLTIEQRTVANLAKQLIEAYDAYKKEKSEDKYEKFAKCYNNIIKSNYRYILNYPEMMGFTKKLQQRGN
jgi:hypothetical protein